MESSSTSTPELLLFRSYISRIFYFYSDFYWRSTVVLFAVTVQSGWLSMRWYRTISMNRPHFLWLTDVDGKLWRGSRKMQEKKRKSTEYQSNLSSCGSQSAKHWLETVVRVRDAWITRKKWWAAKKQEKFFPSFFVTVFCAVDCEWLVGRSRFLIRFYDLNCEACQADDDVIIFAMITYESCGSGLDQRSSPRLRAGDEEIDSDHSFFRFDFRCDNLRRREIKKFAIVLWSQRQHHRFATKQILKKDKSHLPSERNDSGGMEEILCATFHRRTPDTTPTEWHLVWRKITAWHWF